MVRNNLIFLLLIITFSGCISSPYREVKPDEIIENKNLSFVAPMGWRVVKEYPWNNYLNENGTPGLYKDIHGSNLTFHIFTDPYRTVQMYILFDKDEEYYDSNNRVATFDKIDKEQGIKYKKGWITYVNGLKCSGGVYSRSGGIGSKNYSIACGYYDTTEIEDDGKRVLRIDYRYNYMSDYYNSLLQDKGVPRKEWFTREEAEAMLKDAVKQAVQTLTIKNIDIPRMEKEGLIHYDKEFKSTKW